MRRGLVHLLAWLLATGAATALSWWGVHTVLAGTVYDPPLALPIPSGTGPATDADADAGAGPGAKSGAAGTSPPPPATPASPPAPATAPATKPPARGTRTAPPPSSPPGPPSPSAGSPTPAKSGGDRRGTVKSYGTDGGRAVFDLGPSSAELVSATPGAGWQMQVWKQPLWIRVTFTRDDREISVFCMWHDGAPHVQVDER